jgi:hypothetical protein
LPASRNAAVASPMSTRPSPSRHSSCSSTAARCWPEICVVRRVARQRRARAATRRALACCRTFFDTRSPPVARLSFQTFLLRSA